MASDPFFLAVGWLATLAMGIGKGAFGGGLAMLGIPLLSLVVAPVDAAIIVAPLVALMDIFAINAFPPRSWSKPDLVWLAPGLVAGVSLGAAVFVFVDARIVTLLIAMVTLTFTGHWFVRGRVIRPANRPVSPPLALLAGTAGGFTTFVAHSGGPPLAMYLLSRGLDKTLFAGTMVAFFTAGNIVKLPPYLAVGAGRPAVLVAALALTPAVPLGVFLGKRMHDRLPQQTLFFWCYVVLALAATKLFVDAVRAFL